MEDVHPIEKEEKFKNELQSRKVNYTRHFERDRLPYRQNVTKNLIEKHLEDPKDLVKYKHEEDDHNREKYQVLFDKSTKYYLKIVLSMTNGDLFIVTAHVINKTKKKLSQMIG
jgi:hypothetical protein